MALKTNTVSRLSDALQVSRSVVENRIERAAEWADQAGRPHFLTAHMNLDQCDPLALYGRAVGSEHRFYWSQPARGLAISSCGAEATIETKGAERFEDAWSAVAEIGTTMVDLSESGDSASKGSSGSLFVGGFGFADHPGTGGVWQGFPTARLVLPGQWVRSDTEGHEAWVNQRVVPGGSTAELAERLLEALFEVVRTVTEANPRAPEAVALEKSSEYAVVGDRAHQVYRGQVAEALEEIAAGTFEKVVLARALDVRHPGRFAVEAFLESLRETYPSCTTLAVSHGEDTLVAASPELLLRRSPGRVETCALAGSARRGRTPEEDDALAQSLLESKKERAEHEAVVRSIRQALEPVCSVLNGPTQPELLRVEGIQHLATPLVGDLREGDDSLSVLELAARLHPTAAVGGLPVAAARDWIERKEGLDRGWYAGPIGWLNAAGQGEWWLALRSALIHNASEPQSISTARLFAGAGIVSGSDPELELRETRLKLRALLAPLTEI